MRPHTPRLLHDALLVSAHDHPDKIAVVAADERIAYGELHDRVARLARGLQDRGVRRGDRVAVYLENGIDAVVAIYGALLAGAAFVVVNPQTKADKLAYVLADCGAAAIVTGARLAQVVADVRERVPSLHTLVQTGDDAEAKAGSVSMRAVLEAAEPAPRASGTIPLDLAALVYTSGSTGNPKGVMLSHQNMTFAQGSLVEYLRLGHEDRILNVLPLAFDYGLYQLLMTVHLGATWCSRPRSASRRR
jgi:long-chain acyl-CoA synthetase